MSDSVEVWVDGVERAALSAGEAESRLGLAGNRLHACVLPGVLSGSLS